jgi:hypothetical protein
VAQDDKPAVKPARFQISAVEGKQKGEYAVFVVDQTTGDLWKYDSTSSGFTKVAGPIK